LQPRREKYHHSLRALAIREGKIHVVGRPELKIEGTPVYLDVEGLPDRDFYYLIGVRVETTRGVVQHCLWANGADQEKQIWRQFLKVLSEVEAPILIHYGSYETTFLKKMCERYGVPPRGSVAEKALASPLNLVSFLFGQIYFPIYANGLKDCAKWLG